MASLINASTSGAGGLITTADASGQLELQTAGTTAVTVDSSQVASFANDFGTVAGYPAYQCRAWVNFNGTGTVAIRASGNVSSITDLGTGYYQVNFSTSLPDNDYAVSGILENRDAAYMHSITTGGYSTAYIRIRTAQSNVPSGVDYAEISVSVIR